MNIICTDDTSRPNEVPSTRWIKKGEIYTLKEVCQMNVQGGITGIKIHEINNDDLGIYKFFRSSRFEPI